MEATSLTKKLRIKPNEKILLINAPEYYRLLLSPLPDGVKLTSQAKGKFTSIHLFATTKEELTKKLQQTKKLLSENAMLWFCYPKISSGIKSDINRDSAMTILENSGLRFISLISVDKTWSAFGLRLEMIAPVIKARIVSAEEEKFIDKEKRIVKTPPDLLTVLKKDKKALEYFNSLAFSHKKEYVLWIIEAKKIETRTARIQKTFEKVLSGLKNPADKK